MSQVHYAMGSSVRVKMEEEEDLPMGVEMSIPEMKQSAESRPAVTMGQGAFKPFKDPLIAVASPVATSGKDAEASCVKPKTLSQSSLFRYFQ